MPEVPDLTVYLEGLEARIANQKLLRARLLNPFLLRTAVPPLSQLEGKRVLRLRRIGKRLVLEFEDALFLVLHLMVAGRRRWLEGKAKPPGRKTLALLDVETRPVAIAPAQEELAAQYR